ncbi:protein of unknown function [Burkholderia multivorans]
MARLLPVAFRVEAFCTGSRNCRRETVTAQASRWRYIMMLPRPIFRHKSFNSLTKCLSKECATKITIKINYGSGFLV